MIRSGNLMDMENLKLSKIGFNDDLLHSQETQK